MNNFILNNIIIKYFKSNLLKTSVVYSFFNLLNSALPFLLIPFLTRFLTTEDYGKISMITLFVTFLSPIVGLSAVSIVTKNYFQVSNIKLRHTIQSVFVLLISSCLFLLFIFFIFKSQLYYFFSLKINLIFIGLVLASTQFIISLTSTIFQMENRPFIFGLIQFTQTLINTFLTFFLIYYIKSGWEGRIQAWISANIILSIISLILLYKKSFFNEFKLNVSVIKEIIRYCFPIIPYTMSGMIIAMNDRFFVNKILGSSYVGIYTLGLQIGGILNIIFVSINSAFVPWLFKKIAQNYSSNYIIGTFYIFSTIMIIISFLFWGFTTVMLHFVIGEKFMQISNYLYLFILTNVFNSIYLIFTNYFIYKGETKVLALNTFVVTLFNLPLCYYLIKFFYLEGAVFATMITSLITLILTIISANKYFKFPWFAPIFKF